MRSFFKALWAFHVKEMKKVTPLECAVGLLVGASVLIVAWSWLSWKICWSCDWTLFGDWYRVHTLHGSVTLLRFENCQFEHTLRFELELAPPPGASNESCWEGIGYTIFGQAKWFGFAAAYGKWWPPFVWMHPKMPFQAVQIPLWFITVSLMAWPVSRWCRSLIWRRSRSLEPTDQKAL